MIAKERKLRDERALMALAKGIPYARVAARHGLSISQLWRRVGKKFAAIKSARESNICL